MGTRLLYVALVPCTQPFRFGSRRLGPIQNYPIWKVFSGSGAKDPDLAQASNDTFLRYEKWLRYALRLPP